MPAWQPGAREWFAWGRHGCGHRGMAEHLLPDFGVNERELMHNKHVTMQLRLDAANSTLARWS
jgi:hypothetical protein